LQAKLKSILRNKWGFADVEILHQFDVGGGRIVFKVKTEKSIIIIKGQPINVQESSIVSTIRAHEYLGNMKGIAPKLYYLVDGSAFYKDTEYYFFVMEFINGRQVQDTVDDEFLLGQAAARLHSLTDYNYHCPFNINDDIKQFKDWYVNRDWKSTFDDIIMGLPDFYQYRQCFIHSDIGPNNTIIDECGKVIFIDLDDSGIGPQFIDLGLPFISRFVEYNKQTQEIYYKLEIAKAFLDGYCSVRSLSMKDYDLIWSGAVFTHIYNMQWFGEDAADSLWKKLIFGLEQKDRLWRSLVKC
jgi:Ser/Thr protein kinase RdoA (MazF antagonist)